MTFHSRRSGMRRRPPPIRRSTATSRTSASMRLPAPNGCTAWNATREQRQESVHNEAKFMASYVTGSHNIKVGIENDWGPGRQRKNTRNGHLQQRYVNNQPSTVEVFNNPVIQPAYVAYDVGIFVQDSWTMKRLTINPGLRVQWVETGMYESSMAAGRFAPARFIEEERGPDRLRRRLLAAIQRGVRPLRRRPHRAEDAAGASTTATTTATSRRTHTAGPENAARCARGSIAIWLQAPTTRPARRGAMPRRPRPSDRLRWRRAGQRDRDQPERRRIREPRSARSQAAESRASVQRRVHGGRAAPGDPATGRRRDVLQAQDRRPGVPGSAEHHARPTTPDSKRRCRTCREIRTSPPC